MGSIDGSMVGDCVISMVGATVDLIGFSVGLVGLRVGFIEGL